MKKYIILVAGYEYSRGGTNFAYFADNRRKYLLQRNPSWNSDPEVIFVRFDVKNGKLEKNIFDGHQRSWTLERSFDAINRSRHYTGTEFRKQATNVISITDAYSYIVNLGKTEPGTVHEFSILGHGWQGGPILVNSYERDEYKFGGSNYRLRDPWDKDGRNKDFFDSNMNDSDWRSFKNAFANNGYIWVWGCVFTRAYYNTLYKIIRTPEFRRKTFGTHLDTDSFTITVNSSFVQKYYDFDRRFFPADDNERTFTRTMANIKQFLKRGLINTYAGRTALDTGLECRAGYLGTYSSFERSSGSSVRHRIMVVPRSQSLYGDNFTRVINFYKSYLSMPEDPENRGYARYRGPQVYQWFQSV
ncbi:MAG: hypothetical protein PHH93_02895 [Prolixibacteraceae bacterium]|nr:hypothetical protein [Prolixibacteraceae bacterium]